MENQHLWYDIDSNRHYILRGGDKLECDGMGKKPKCFIPYFTGQASYEARLQLSNKINKFSILPPVSPSSSQKHIKSFANFNHLDKFDGYAQFPHPRKNLLLFKESFSTKLKQRIKWKVTGNKYYTDVRKSCNINHCNSIKREKNGLPSKRLLYNSNIKAHHINLLRGTFTPLKNQHNEALKFLEADNELSRNRHLRGSYNKIQSSLKKEEIELRERYSSSVKEKRYPIKGLYQIHISTEGELYIKAKKRRAFVNNKAAAEELKYEKKDFLLLKKRREQSLLKQNAIKGLLRIKEKPLKRRINFNNNTLL